MKFLYTLSLFLIITFSTISAVHAQTAETIWIQADTTAYKTGETVTVTLNAVSATLIQGFTVQIRYDPACLQPINGTSPISGMNGMAVPQASGLVDASFASTTPQTANGILAQVYFQALKGCQTNLTIESAALVIRNELGFAEPLTGVSIDNKAVTLSIDSEAVAIQPTAILSGSVLPLAPTILPEPESVSGWVIALIGLLIAIFIATIFVVYRLSRK